MENNEFMQEIEDIYQKMKEKCREGGAGNDMQIFNYCKTVFIDALAESHSAGFNRGWNDAEKQIYKDLKVE
jgi:hypothetical protein